MICPHCAGPHTLSQCPTWRSLLDAQACGGDFGSNDRHGDAEDALGAFVDSLIEAERAGGAKLVCDQLELQHARLGRMTDALRQIKRAIMTAPTRLDLTTLALYDMAEAGLK